MNAQQTIDPASDEATLGGRAARVKRLWTLGLLLVLVWAAGQRFVGIATDPQFQVHSDDLIWMWRFVNLPRPALPTQEVDYAHLEYIRFSSLPADDLEYVHGIDQSALERWLYHYVLSWSGKLPQSLPLQDWDYQRDNAWNIEQGNIAPAAAVRPVRVANAALMIGAVILIYAAVARARTPVAGFIAGCYVVLHRAVVEVLWSIGSDPLLWFLAAAALLLWVLLGASTKAAVAVGIVGGLAACAKLNGAVVSVGFVAWMLLKGKPRQALVAAALGLGVFILVNPIVFSRGISGVPAMLSEMLWWRMARAEIVARQPEYAVFADAPRWKVFFWLLGTWWPLLPLLLVSGRFWRLDAAVFWASSMVIGHALTVTAPVARYTFALQTGLVLGLLAAYWPARLSAARNFLLSVYRRATRREKAPPY